MAGMKKVLVTIEADGSSKVDAVNFMGKGCAKATEAIELTLGGGAPGNSSDKRKPEFAMNPGAKQTI